MKKIYDYTYSELEQLLIGYGEKKFRAKQIFQWLYRKRITEFKQMSDISKSLIEKLEKEFELMPLKVIEKQVSKDKTTKYLSKLSDGSLIETVLMHFDYGKSVCVTSQVGCNMGCKFCASGLLKKKRDLTSGEMVAQIMMVQKELDLENERVSHVVVMGTGEPFDNYDNVMNFLKIINSDLGLAIASRHLTVSTCGLVDKIKRFSQENMQVNLAISLHAPSDEIRNKIMPINQAYDLKQLIDAVRYYIEKTNRRVTFEYILLKDVNDLNEHAVLLAKLLKGLNAYVNLIPYNSVDEHEFKSVSKSRALVFYDWLVKNGIRATIRKEHGNDIDAACGQLRAKREMGN